MLLVAKMNRLTGDEMKPWHLKATYQIVDDEQNVTDEGTIEEFWAGESKVKCIFTGKSFTQTYYITQRGTYRVGKMNSEFPLLWYVEREFVQPIPFPDGALSKQLTFGVYKRQMGTTKLLCINVEDRGKRALDGFLAPAYCIDPDLPILRIGSHQDYIHRFVHNHAFMFQGHYLPSTVTVGNGDMMILIAQLERVEPIKTLLDPDFTPGPDAIFQPQFKSAEVVPARVGGLELMVRLGDLQPINRPKPECPPIAIAKHVHGTVTLQAEIGTDGHVSYLQVIGGPAILEQAVLDAVWKWTFEPYTPRGEPTLVTTTIEVPFSCQM